MVHSETNFLRATMPLTISPISRWISGSPPGIATMGAPHSSTASRHSLTDEPPVEDRIGIVDLAAADAGEIAAEQRLQHQHERIAFAPHELLLEDVGADAHFLQERHLHFLSSLSGPGCIRFARPRLDICSAARGCRAFVRLCPIAAQAGLRRPRAVEISACARPVTAATGIGTVRIGTRQHHIDVTGGSTDRRSFAACGRMTGGHSLSARLVESGWFCPPRRVFGSRVQRLSERC